MREMIIKTMQGLTKKEFEAIKEAAKAEINLPVSLRYHTQRYAFGAIDIQPRSKSGKQRLLTPEEVDHVIDFCKRHNLDQRLSYFNADTRQYVYQSGGFCYLMKVL
jgi:hypothetical protein